MKFLNKKAEKEYTNMVSSNKIIEVTAGECRYNFRCHFNTVHDAINNGDSRIAMCMVVMKYSNYPYIHYVNVNSDGVFTDNTLGHWHVEGTYYLIKYIEKKDFFNIDNIFREYRNQIRKKLSFLVRLMSDYYC